MAKLTRNPPPPQSEVEEWQLNLTEREVLHIKSILGRVRFDSLTENDENKNIHSVLYTVLCEPPFVYCAAYSRSSLVNTPRDAYTRGGQ